MTVGKLFSKTIVHVNIVLLLFVGGQQFAYCQGSNSGNTENPSSEKSSASVLDKKYSGVKFSVENGFNTAANHLDFIFVSSNNILVKREMLLSNNVSKWMGINFGLDYTARNGLYVNCINVGGNFSGSHTPAYVRFTTGIGYSFFIGDKKRLIIRPHVDFFFQSFDYSFGGYDSTAAFVVNGQNQNLGFTSVKLAYINSIIGTTPSVDFVTRMGKKHVFDLFVGFGWNHVLSSQEKITIGLANFNLQNQTFLNDDQGTVYDRNIMTLKSVSAKIGFVWEF